MSSETEILRQKANKEIWLEKGYAFQSNLIANLPAGVSYYLFNPIAISGKLLYVEPAIFRAEDGPITLHYRVGHDYTGGTAQNSFNRNSNSSITPQLVITSGPTGTSVGAINSSNLIGNTGGPVTSGGGVGGGGEMFIAPTSITFLLQYTNNSGGAVDVEYDLRWFEVPISD